MITTSIAPFVLEAGADQAFNGSTILVEPAYFFTEQKWRVALRVLSSVDTMEIYRAHLLFTKAQIDAFTGTGTGDTAKAVNAIEQAVVYALSAIADNVSVTFTIV